MRFPCSRTGNTAFPVADPFDLLVTIDAAAHDVGFPIVPTGNLPRRMNPRRPVYRPADSLLDSAEGTPFASECIPHSATNPEPQRAPVAIRGSGEIGEPSFAHQVVELKG